ncbi:unnamed protein product [Aureobasidium mustum]|uniref:Alpha-1,6 mannosyltransferase subunit n=1 Tax=Aureobasidium mustum TaxID=2773714 RepID=A0A9N8JQX6_9PEZI|nr:unnamed protein product [Aureobasidium mustum]
MAVARSIRRTNPITLVLGGLLTIGFLIFIFSSTDAGPALHVPGARQLLKSKDAASNALSPPSLPFFKSNLKAGEKALLRQFVLILTPLARFYEEYWTNLVALTYPHDLISLGFIIPKGREGNAATAQLQEQIARTQASSKRFASITILRQEDEPPLTSQSEHDRHAMSAQKERRAAMSRARNALLFTTLGPTTSWVLWLDSDIVETPHSLIQDLAAFDKPIIVPNCFQRFYDKEKGAMDVRPYDFNSWIDSNTAQNLASKMGPDEILLEGYAEMATYRSLMAYMSHPGGNPKDIVNLDGVGGTALLVKGDVHRDGAMFPPFPFYHLIETEGFAKMAKRLGWSSWGVPNYFVYHYNE